MTSDQPNANDIPGDREGLPGHPDNHAQARPASENVENQYQRLYDKAPMSYQSLDAEGHFVQVNQAFLDTLGYSRDEVIGRWFGDFLAPHMVETFRAKFPIFKSTGKTTVVFEMKHKNGSIVTMSIDGRIDFDENGRFRQTHCILQDITERKQAEEALRESEAKYRALFEQMTQGAFYQRADGVLDDVNPAALRLFGLSRDEFLGKTSEDPYWKVVTEEGCPLAPEKHPSMLAIVSGEPVKDTILGVYRPDIGDYVWLSVSAIPQFKPGQAKPERAFVTLHDITEKKKAEDALRASEQRFRCILEKIQLIGVELNIQGRVIFCNDFLLQLTGLTRDEVIGQDWFERFLPEADRSVIHQVFERTIHEIEFPPVYENPIQTSGGIQRHIRWNNVLLRDAAGQVSSVVSLGEDVTERKLAIEALYESEDRYRDVAESMSGWIWEVNVAGVYTYVSPKIEDVLGYRCEDVIGKTPFDLMPEDEARRATAFFQGVVRRKKPIRDFENWNVHKNGKLVCLLSNGVPMLDRQGNLTGYRGVDRDISGRKRAEKELQRIHTLLNEAQSMARIGGWEYDVTKKVIIWTDEVYRIHGVGHDYNPRNLSNDFRFYTAESSAILWRAFSRAVKGGEPYDLELELTRADGVKIWVRTVARPIVEDGKVVRLIGNIQDITQRRQAEKQYQILFHEMFNGFALHEIICDEHGRPVDYRFLAVNPAFERLTGLKADELLGKTVREVLPNTESVWIERYGRVALSGKPVFFENNAQDLGRYYEVSAFQPAPGQFACIFADITERKEAETKLKDQMEELRRWHALTLGREGRVIELKREVNELLIKAGQRPRYQFADNEI